jgi:peptidoglycan lytic transglycosylase A
MFATPARVLFVFLFASGLSASLTEAKGLAVEPVSFTELTGWDRDDHAEALRVFLKSCAKIRSTKKIPKEVWAPACAQAKTGPDAKVFFEKFFQPVIIEPQSKTLFTGYYEPELQGALHRGGRYQYPVYRRPAEVVPGKMWKTRAEIESGILENRGLELVWLTDPVERFFLHVQGSGRIVLNDGGYMRIGFDGKNGFKYRSVGKEMIRRGIFRKTQASAARIKAWVKQNPVQGKRMLQFNPSFVFFREIRKLDTSEGPLGAMRISVTKTRSIAVDKRFTPLGAPVWIEKSGQDPMNRLMVAQDVGSAIKGPQRADIFFGSGPVAAKLAGRTKSPGRMYVLLPKEIIKTLVPDG